VKYFVVVQVLAYPIDEHQFAVESAFAAHLVMLKELIGPEFDELVLVGVSMPQGLYEQSRNHLQVLDTRKSGVRFVAALAAGVSRPRFILTGLVPLWSRLRRLFAEPCVVQSGMSTQLAKPLMFMASLAARSHRRPVVFMVDIDFRQHAWRFLQTGQWSRKSYLINRYGYDPLKWLQLWLAPRLFDLCLYKSDSMVRDFGRGRPNVRNFFDTVHAAEDVLTTAELDSRIERLRSRDGLTVTYFGRLAANKGLDRVIDAVGLARTEADIRLKIIGDGECRESLLKQIEAAGLGDAVTLVPSVPYGEPLFGLMADCDVAVAAPLVEDTPRAAFDAMARGLPVVAFDITYFRDLEAGSKAVICTPWPQPAGLARAFVALAQDREQLVSLAGNAVAFAQANTQRIWLERRLSWLQELLKREA
jgi:glycosyltransferase involved in cell wall biosynthesis